MSRIGKMPITIPNGVEVKVDGSTVTVKGPKGELTKTFSDLIHIAVDNDTIVVTRDNDEQEARSLHGLTRTLIHNMVIGVTEGYKKKLQLVGVGYRAQVKNGGLELSLGYSHPVIIDAIEGITFECPSATEIIVSGIDKQQVGQVTADVRGWRPPEPYKGKGIRYEDEHIRRKLGKAASSG